MQTNTSHTESKTIKSAKAASPSTAPDATALLREDHAKVSGLFEDYGKARTASRKKTLVAQICAELTVHTQIEEEIFYPAVKKALKDKELVPEALVEHATLKALIAEVAGKEPDGQMFDAKIQVLSEYVHHHVREEHTELFPKAKSTDLDMYKLGAQLKARKAELLTQQD